jgi:hypothetical protein
MLSIILQSILPFIFSALIVIIITVVAEKYGTKVGGILGTMPSTVVIAFVFIAINKGTDFASESVAVVPAVLGVNLIFLFVFALLCNRSIILALTSSFTIWAVLSYFLYILDFKDIYLSLVIYAILLVFTFVTLEYYIKIPSIGKKQVHYTFQKIVFRGIVAGIVISISVLLSNLGAVLSGIFSVFPAILTSTMIITIREHGPNFSAAIGKSMIFGISSVCAYAIIIHFLYPILGILYGTIIAFVMSFIITIILFQFRNTFS